MHLTDLKLRSLPFEAGQRDYPDDATTGLSVRVGKRTKTFMLTLRNPRRRISLGHYPELTLSRARERARDLLAEARLAKDQLISLTFEEAKEQFKKLHVPTMRPGTQKACIWLLDTNFSQIEKRPITSLRTSELAAIVDGIEAPSTRRNAFVWLRVMLNWCYRRGYLDTNPISRLSTPICSRPRERVLSDSELTKVWNASYELNLEAFGAFVRLLILTGQRKGQWEQFRPEFVQGDTIVFPAGMMKEDKSHIIPLTELIHSTIGNHAFTRWSTAHHKRYLDKLSGVKDWTLHDLRRTFATKLAEMGTPPHVIERILAHSSGVISGIAAIYNRASYQNEMREALLKLETRLHTLLSNTESTTNARDISGLHRVRA